MGRFSLRAWIGQKIFGRKTFVGEALPFGGDRPIVPTSKLLYAEDCRYLV